MVLYAMWQVAAIEWWGTDKVALSADRKDEDLLGCELISLPFPLSLSRSLHSFLLQNYSSVAARVRLASKARDTQ